QQVAEGGEHIEQVNGFFQGDKDKQVEADNGNQNAVINGVELAFNGGLFEIASVVPEPQWCLYGTFCLYPQQHLVIAARRQLQGEQEMRMLYRPFGKGHTVAGYYFPQ